jgi:hypothetical protein
MFVLLAETDSCFGRTVSLYGVAVLFDEMCDSALSEHDALLDTNHRQFALFDQSAYCVFGQIEQLGCITDAVELKVVRFYHGDLQKCLGRNHQLSISR